MKRNSFRLAVCCLLWLILWPPVPVKADVIFPARLEIKEIEPGIFEVVFVLPVVQGKVLKAQPILPDRCKRLTDPEVSGDFNMKISRWQVSCLADSLHGEKFGIEGLLGSPVDILFKLEMYDGRIYESMLSPVNAFFIIPNPPSFFQLLQQAILSGLSSLLQHGALYLLILVLSFSASFKRSKLVRILWLMVFGYAVGQQLAAADWLLVPENLPALATLAAALFLGMTLLYHRTLPSIGLAWLFLLLGMVYGSIDYYPQAQQGYNSSEHLVFNLISFLGTAIGIFIIHWLSDNFIYLLTYLIKEDKTRLALGYLVSIMAAGSIIYQLSTYYYGDGTDWNIPWLPVLFVWVLSLWVTRSGLKDYLLEARLLFLLIAGCLMSHLGIQWNWVVAGILVSILMLVIYHVFRKAPSNWIKQSVIAFGAMACGFYINQMASEEMSYAQAQTAGFVITLGLIYILMNQWTRWEKSAISSPRFRSIIYVVLGIGVVWAWYAEFSESHLEQMIADYTLGQLPIPVLSLLLVVLAIWFWPRYKSIHKSMGMKRRAPVVSLILLGLALLISPWFVWKTSNPFSSPGIPDLNQAEVVVQQVLSNTYHAFNLEDEDILYERLAENVDQQLIEDIYLDSRRKLRAGVRQGAEVLVKEVELLDINTTEDQSGPNELIFETTWVVTARVKHLQHIHHRKNRYSGSISLKTAGPRWKISDITLTSEDRTILPNTSG